MQGVAGIGVGGRQPDRDVGPRLVAPQRVAQVEGLPLQGRPGLVLEPVDGHVTPVPAADHEGQQSVTCCITSFGRRRACRQPGPVPFHGRGGVRGGVLQVAAERNRGAGRHGPAREVGEEQEAALALPHGPVAPGLGHVPLAEGSPRAMQEGGEGAQPRHRGLDARLRIMRFIASGKGDDGEERFPDRERGVATDEVARVVLRQAGLQYGVGQCAVDGLPVTPAQFLGVQHAVPGFGQLTPHRAHLAARRADRFRREVGKRVVMVVNAGEGGRHRTAPIEAVEERVE